jgi:phosphatidylglycerophosphate synthase
MTDIFQKVKEGIFRNLANAITAVGIILTVWLNSLLWNEPVNHLLIFILAVGVGLSDLIDGWLARHWQIATSIGGSLDKFRDKLFTCSLFAYFLRELWYWADGVWLALVKGLIILILIIELFLVAVWIIGFVKGFDVSSHLAGKIKTTFYFIAIGWWLFLKWLGSLLQRDFRNYLFSVLIFLLLTASIYGILSVVGYLQRYYNSYNNSKESMEG